MKMADVGEKIILSEHLHPIKGIHLVNGTSAGNYETSDLINEICKKVGSNITIKSFANTEITITSKTRAFFKILLVDSLELFYRSMKVVAANCLSLRGYYLIIFKNATFDDMRKIFKFYWESYVHHVNILTRNSSEFVFVYSFVPFSEFGCNKTEPVELTRFSNGSFNPQPKYFFPNKFKNFHRCPIKVATFESLAPSVLRENYANGSYRLYGRDVDTYTTLSKELNFKLDIFYITPFGGWGILYPNGSATGSMGRAIRREADFVLGNIYLKYDRSKVMDYSYVNFLDQLVLMIPPEKNLTSLKKLIRPFEVVVWMILSGTIFCGIVVVATVELQSKEVKEFCFGKQIKNPYMNVLIAIFGGSQHVLPSRNFPRYLLMNFLLFCMVIR